MSYKRILGITAFGILFIVAVIGVMLLTSYLGEEGTTVPLPVTTGPVGNPGETETDALDRVEVTRETVQAVVSTLSRPGTYNREIEIESFWDDGQAVYFIDVAVHDGVTSLRTVPPAGGEKRIIVTADKLYIWYGDDRLPFIGDTGSSGDGYRTADEYQMIATYETILELDIADIIDAGYTEYGGEDCVYVEYLTKKLGYTVRYYVSIELGLITGAEEFDETGALVYRMRAGKCNTGETDPAAFTLPDGTVLITIING